MNNQEVPHIWANGQKASGKGSNLFFEGNTIYSYGRHFPLARRVVMLNGDVHFIVNRARYSVSTSKHQSYVRAAIAGDAPRYYVDPKLVAWDTLTDVDALRAAVEKQNAADVISGEAEKARRKEDARRRRQDKKERDARANYAIANFAGDLRAWRDGTKPFPVVNPTRATYLRVSGEDIETSRGARVPVSVCRRVWPVLRDAVAKEAADPQAAWVPFFSAPDFKWGNYVGVSLFRIAKGSPVSVRVGCHEFAFSEVEEMARELNLA